MHGFELGYELELGHGSKYTTLASNMFKTVLGVSRQCPVLKCSRTVFICTCSKREFSCIFKGYWSRIFADFRQFRDFQQFWSSFWTLPGRAMISNAFIFLHFLWIRAIFMSKSMKFRCLVQSVTGTWPKAFRTWKFVLFAKCYLDVVKTRFFMHFQRILIDCTFLCCFCVVSMQISRFSRKSTISNDVRGLQKRIFRKIRCFWSVTHFRDTCSAVFRHFWCTKNV